MLRNLSIAESRARASELCAGPAMAGHQVAAVLPSALDLAAQFIAESLALLAMVLDSFIEFGPRRS